jgi:hypothetical protein
VSERGKEAVVGILEPRHFFANAQPIAAARHLNKPRVISTVVNLTMLFSC